jgi:hypothetical protein
MFFRPENYSELHRLGKYGTCSHRSYAVTAKQGRERAQSYPEFNSKQANINRPGKENDYEKIKVHDVAHGFHNMDPEQFCPGIIS